MNTWLTSTKITVMVTIIMIAVLLVAPAYLRHAAAQTQFITQTASGSTVVFRNVSSKVIREMGGDLLDSGQVIGTYKHTFYVSGFAPGAIESMSVIATKPSVAFKYIYFADGTSWNAPAALGAQTASGQTLTLDQANSWCKPNTFTPGSTLHGTWQNTATGCVGTGSVEKQAPYVCSKDPSYGYPDLAMRSCKAGICCTIQYTALRPTVSADTGCNVTGNGFYTGVQGDQSQ